MLPNTRHQEKQAIQGNLATLTAGVFRYETMKVFHFGAILGQSIHVSRCSPMEDFTK